MLALRGGAGAAGVWRRAGIGRSTRAEERPRRPGAFYLDRAVRRKHLAGPFFTDGSATKNTAAEVAAMVADLNALADAKLSAE